MRSCPTPPRRNRRGGRRFGFGSPCGGGLEIVSQGGRSETPRGPSRLLGQSGVLRRVVLAGKRPLSLTPGRPQAGCRGLLLVRLRLRLRRFDSHHRRQRRTARSPIPRARSVQRLVGPGGLRAKAPVSVFRRSPRRGDFLLVARGRIVSNRRDLRRSDVLPFSRGRSTPAGSLSVRLGGPAGSIHLLRFGTGPVPVVETQLETRFRIGLNAPPLWMTHLRQPLGEARGSIGVGGGRASLATRTLGVRCRFLGPLGRFLGARLRRGRLSSPLRARFLSTSPRAPPLGKGVRCRFLGPLGYCLGARLRRGRLSSPLRTRFLSTSPRAPSLGKGVRCRFLGPLGRCLGVRLRRGRLSSPLRTRFLSTSPRAPSLGKGVRCRFLGPLGRCLGARLRRGRLFPSNSFRSGRAVARRLFRPERR